METSFAMALGTRANLRETASTIARTTSCLISWSVLIWSHSLRDSALLKRATPCKSAAALFKSQPMPNSTARDTRSSDKEKRRRNGMPRATTLDSLRVHSTMPSRGPPS
eukprot:CAMPEP_0177548500 /NCGR_PEP_ID=MMETSP0369-20130122/64487_1 /TAXON_ID=447022 ORGANISM="Scrippsiella hangoei-like, Strain SHHI-4" /NCGR_SAMPLE_ID=MMETSP0369 /ASSEMBLY_ACC=CAM_ASM_000364 /LENGTH=108 /DNA_ID=CAMNT_0019033469 /DNA_START=254 /DNA_END=580 /DNA_ORIENTATION=+